MGFTPLNFELVAVYIFREVRSPPEEMPIFRFETIYLARVQLALGQ
jgi:hypothetical protein